MNLLEELMHRYPTLAPCRPAIETAYRALETSFAAGGKLMVCGNGGSAADADHIVGELMKAYLRPRRLSADAVSRLRTADPVIGPTLADSLQGALPALNLAAGSALLSAFGNDVKPELAYAQAAWGYGRRGDVLLGISTSGNAANVRAALAACRAAGITTIGLTGRTGGKMAGLCDILVAVPADRTFEIQELHLPVYHCLCAMVEERFFP